jgi:replicative DNA helicase
MTEQEPPVKDDETLRHELLGYLAGWIESQREASSDPDVRLTIIRKVTSELCDVFRIGRVAESMEESKDTISTCRLFLRRPLEQVGLGDSLQTLIVSARRRAIRVMGGKEALGDIADASSSMSQVAEMVDRIAGGTEHELCVPTGLTDLDGVMNGGLPKGEVVLVGAATGAGKTTFAMFVADHAARLDKGTVMVVSPEMRAQDLWFRLALHKTGYSRRDLRPNSLEQDMALKSVLAMTSQLSAQCNPVLLDRADANMAMTMDAARAVHYQRGPLLLLICDYAQTLSMGDGSMAPRYLEVAKVATEGLELAAETGAAVLITSQINQHKNKDGVVVDASFRESAVLEHKASVAMILTADKEQNQARFMIRKNRHGPQVPVEVFYRAETFTMGDLEGQRGNW